MGYVTMTVKDDAGRACGFQPLKWRAEDLLGAYTPEQLARMLAEKELDCKRLEAQCAEKDMVIEELSKMYVEKDNQHQAEGRRFRRAKKMVLLLVEQNRATKPPPRRTRKDNLALAIFGAWDSGFPLYAPCSELFEYLATQDSTGYIRARNGDELKWENTLGGESYTTKVALAARLKGYRVKYELKKACK